MACVPSVPKPSFGRSLVTRQRSKGSSTLLILGRDIFISRIPTNSHKSGKFFNVEQGWTPRDTEIVFGPWEIIISIVAETS